MDSHVSSAALTQGKYAVTSWSEVARAAGPDSAERLAALESLISKYYGPLCAHLQFKFLMTKDQAQDAMQDFVSSKMLGQLLSKASRERGRFRTFLLNSLDNFVKSTFRRQGAQKRSPYGGVVSLEFLLEHSDVGLSSDQDPFIVEWARSILDEALRRMQRECQEAQCVERWELFHARAVAPHLEGREKEPYEKLVLRLGYSSAAKAQNALATAKQQFSRVITSVILDFEGPAANADDELGALLRALSK